MSIEHKNGHHQNGYSEEDFTNAQIEWEQAYHEEQEAQQNPLTRHVVVFESRSAGRDKYGRKIVRAPREVVLVHDLENPNRFKSINPADQDASKGVDEIAAIVYDDKKSPLTDPVRQFYEDLRKLRR